MQNNVGTILGGVALVVSLANSYFLFNMSNKNEGELPNEVVSQIQDQNISNQNMQQNGMMQPSPMVQNPEPAAPQPTGPPTSISFKKMEHDFGTVKQNSENTYEFSFTNSGNNPLVITDAKGSCGCTVPEYPKEPIAPGASSKIKVVYSPGSQEGEQNKNVTITANTEPQQTVISIKAKVIK